MRRSLGVSDPFRQNAFPAHAGQPWQKSQSSVRALELWIDLCQLISSWAELALEGWKKAVLQDSSTQAMYK